MVLSTIVRFCPTLDSFTRKAGIINDRHDSTGRAPSRRTSLKQTSLAAAGAAGAHAAGRWPLFAADDAAIRIGVMGCGGRGTGAVLDALGAAINEAQAVAESTMTGITGREAVYSGQAVTWEKAMQVQTRLGPPEYAMGTYAIPPVAMPGQYRFD